MIINNIDFQNNVSSMFTYALQIAKQRGETKGIFQNSDKVELSVDMNMSKVNHIWLHDSDERGNSFRVSFTPTDVRTLIWTKKFGWVDINF